VSNFGVSPTVYARDNWGRFISAQEENAARMVKDAIEEGAALSRAAAPVGSKHDPRTIPLNESIETEMLSRTSGRWVARARHALAMERGARPHPITADVRFWWENEGRWWVPSEGWINHPGNAPQPYLRPAFEEIKRRIMNIARRHYG
jgi:hypothetical protein